MSEALDQLVRDQRAGLFPGITSVRSALPTGRSLKEHSADDVRSRRPNRPHGYSGRIRSYWTEPETAATQRRLLDNFEAAPLPPTLPSAHLPSQYARVRTGHLAPRPHDIVVDRVRDVLRDYDPDCAPRSKEYA
ncbi:class II D-tagatose-bisphosphate aldolase non-catalytic subunit [Streptomyces sp. AC154]|uniref:class II D-tagatose-bisphosphate aldolase non-catalytic subunit n=1 Tax=Streptomyces sp. AC154 TaxID=3143184 RepID=UPI003F82067D